jgi:hypothetical protein
MNVIVFEIPPTTAPMIIFPGLPEKAPETPRATAPTGIRIPGEKESQSSKNSTEQHPKEVPNAKAPGRVKVRFRPADSKQAIGILSGFSKCW